MKYRRWLILWKGYKACDETVIYTDTGMRRTATVAAWEAAHPGCRVVDIIRGPIVEESAIRKGREIFK